LGPSSGNSAWKRLCRLITSKDLTMRLARHGKRQEPLSRVARKCRERLKLATLMGFHS